MSLRYIAVFGLFLPFALSEHSEDVASLAQPRERDATAQAKQGYSPIELAEKVEYTEVYESKAFDLEKKAEDLLHFEKGQGLIAGLAVIIGMVMVYDGEVVFKYLIVLVMAFLTFFGMYVMFQVKCDDSEFNAKWCSTPDHYYGAVFVFVEVTCIVAYVVQRAYAGVQMIFGVAIGVFITQHIHAALVSGFGAAFANNGWLLLGLINIFSLLGVWLISAGKLRGVISPIALVSSACGACLISSSLAFFAMLYVVKVHPKFLVGKIVIPDPDTNYAWIDFLRVLTRPSGDDYKDVGVFAGSKFNPQVNGIQLHLDAIIGCSVWLLFFLLGACIQKRAPFCGAKKSTVSALEEPLNKPGSRDGSGNMLAKMGLGSASAV